MSVNASNSKITVLISQKQIHGKRTENLENGWDGFEKKGTRLERLLALLYFARKRFGINGTFEGVRGKGTYQLCLIQTR